MGILSKRDFSRTAAPLPGASPLGRTPVAPRPRPTPNAAAPQSPDRMNMEEPPMGGEGGPEEMEGAPEGGESKQDVSETIKRLQNDYFSDEKMEQISSSLISLFSSVPPEQSKKLAEIYGKYMEAMAKLKANLASIMVMLAPQAVQMEQMQKIFSPAAESPEDEYEIGPLT